MRRRQALIAALSVLGGGAVAGCDRSEEIIDYAPPVPVIPSAAAALFVPGSRHVVQTGETAVAEVIPAGTLPLPSGRLVAVDPSWLPVASWTPPVGPFTAKVPPGDYPVDLALLHGPDVRVAAARLTVTDEPVATWEAALLAGQDPATLPAGGLFGTGVDTAVISLVDARNLDALGRLCERAPDTFDQVRAEQPLVVAGAVAFKTGWGDGYYPTWVGRTRSGAVGCFVVDMRMLAPAPSGT